MREQFFSDPRKRVGILILLLQGAHNERVPATSRKARRFPHGATVG